MDLPEDVRLMRFPGPVHGILAAPPCTFFCRMRMCRGRPTDEQFREGLSVVDACLRLVTMCRPQWWALENPQGYLHDWLGEPKFKFDPCDFGDPWTKRTWLWGNFTIPSPLFTSARQATPRAQWVNDGTNNGLSRTARENSKTPPAFAQAFFEANP